MCCSEAQQRTILDLAVFMVRSQLAIDQNFSLVFPILEIRCHMKDFTEISLLTFIFMTYHRFREKINFLTIHQYLQKKKKQNELYIAGHSFSKKVSERDR